MRYDPAHSDLYIKNRTRFCDSMESGALALFTSNDILPTNADGTMPFIQNRDLLYLTGIDQEETLLVLFPDAFEEKHREILFVRETNKEIAVWEGAKLSKAQATEQSGIRTQLPWLGTVAMGRRGAAGGRQTIHAGKLLRQR